MAKPVLVRGYPVQIWEQDGRWFYSLEIDGDRFESGTKGAASFTNAYSTAACVLRRYGVGQSARRDYEALLGVIRQITKHPGGFHLRIIDAKDGATVLRETVHSTRVAALQAFRSWAAQRIAAHVELDAAKGRPPEEPELSPVSDLISRTRDLLSHAEKTAAEFHALAVQAEADAERLRAALKALSDD